MVGNLVGRQAVGGADLQGGVVELARGVIVGDLELAGGAERGKRRVWLDGQLIERQVLAGLGQSELEFARPLGRLLPRPGVDQVERVARKHRARDGDGIERLARRMHAAELRQRPIVQRLNAERHPVDPGGPVAAKARGLDAGRVGFERDLDIGRHGPMPGDGVEDRRHRCRLHQRGGAAAEEDRRDGSARHARRGRGDLGRKGGDEPRLVDRLAAYMAVEVAIRTFRQAERPVDIHAELLFCLGGLRQGVSVRQGTPPRA